MPLFLVKRHMAAKGSLQRDKVLAKLNIEEKQLALSSAIRSRSLFAKGRQARGFPFQFQMHKHLLVAFAPQDAVAS